METHPPSHTLQGGVFMKKHHIMLIVAALTFVAAQAFAQFHVSGHAGLKSFGIKGASTQTQGGSVSQLGVADGGKTGFAFGGGVGYTVVSAGVYALDLGLEVDLAFANMFEAGYNSISGSGRYAADGYSGGSTTAIGIDIMPVHRINIPGFSLLSPFAGVGLGLNNFSTADATVGPPTANPTSTVKGKGQFQIGLIVFYGTVIRLAGPIEPFVQLKHYIPFSSEFTFFEDPATVGTIVTKDAPGYFNLAAGVRLAF